MIKVLTVDDDKTAGLIYGAIGRRCGIEFFVVSSGESAIEACEAARFDVILMDWSLDGALDGFQSTALLRQLQQQQRNYVPIIAVTAHALIGDRERSLKAGMDDYLSKPFEIEVLEQLINYWACNRAAVDSKRTGTR